MTIALIASRHASPFWNGRPRLAAIGAALLLVVLAAWLALSPVRNAAGIAPAPAATAKQVALITATSGQASTHLQAIGAKAEMINASLPFASGPVPAASPFAMAGLDVEERRAVLCLTQAVYYEAGFEPIVGRRAVAQVVLNRMRHPAFPKSICGVVYQHSASGICQFSFVCDGALNRPPAAAAWKTARDIATAALGGHVEKSVGSATHYHADYVAPRWASMLAKISKLGQHIFYRWPGNWGLPAAFRGRYAGEPSDPLSLRPRMIRAVAKVGMDGTVVVDVPEVAGPPVARAANDVGGLLDPTKGWSLSIPAPSETEGSAAKLIAKQERREPVAAPGATATVASVAGLPGLQGSR